MPKLHKAAPATTSRAQEAKAKRLITKLCGYHRIGRKANAAGLSTVQLAAKHGLNISTMRKALEFANEYSDTDLTRLCRLRRGKSGDGLPLHWGHVQNLLTADKKDRAGFEDEACKNNWTDQQLYSVIRDRRKDRKPRRSGGRPVRPPSSYLGCVQRLLLDGRPWIRRAETMLENFPVAKPCELTKRHRQQVDETIAVLEQMKQLADALTKDLKRGCRTWK